MIAQKLFPALKEKFSNFYTLKEEMPNRMMRIKAVHPAVGDLLVYDDGDEATVLIEKITHGHFAPYDYELTDEERDSIVTEMVIEFLQELFRDEVLLFKTPSNSMGGWRRLRFNDNPLDLKEDLEYYLWSEPYKADVA